MTYLEITLFIAPQNRPAAASVYAKFKQPFLSETPGARSKEMLVRDEDVQVLHGFDSQAQANAYLQSPLFQQDVVTALTPLLTASPEVRVYSVA